MGKRGRKRSGGTAGQRAGSPVNRLSGQRASGPGNGLSGQRANDLQLTAPTTTYTDADGNQLELRGSLPPGARAEYAATHAGGLHRDDAWQRATELLFERLTVSWTIAGVRTDGQRELLGRYRMASADERRFVRDSLRAHIAEHFPDVEAP